VLTKLIENLLSDEIDNFDEITTLLEELKDIRSQHRPNCVA